MRISNRIAIMALTLTFTACSSAPGGFPGYDREANSHGLQRKQEAAHLKLLDRVEGWGVLVTFDGRNSICVAVKPAKDKSEPVVTSFGTIYGGAGFYMSIADDLDIPYFGFYGDFEFATGKYVEVDGKHETIVDDREIVLSWEGKSIDFEVTSQSDAPSGVDTRSGLGRVNINRLGDLFGGGDGKALGIGKGTQSGIVSLVGVNKAYQAMMNCQARHR